MKFCQHCGKELPDDALICVGCGRIVTAPKPVKPIVALREEPVEAEAPAVETQAVEVKAPVAQAAAPKKDYTWIIRLFSIFFCMVSSVLYAVSRIIEVYVREVYYISKYDIDLKVGAYIYKAPAPMMSALVILGIAAIFSITDISLVGVAVSKRRAESSKLLAPIVTLLFAITLLLIFIFMG